MDHVDSVQDLSRKVEGEIIEVPSPIHNEITDSIVFLTLLQRALNKASNGLSPHPYIIPKLNLISRPQYPKNVVMKEGPSLFDIPQIKDPLPKSTSFYLPHKYLLLITSVPRLSSDSKSFQHLLDINTLFTMQLLLIPNPPSPLCLKTVSFPTRWNSRPWSLSPHKKFMTT